MSDYNDNNGKIEEFICYLSDTKKRTNNTLESYKRDLTGLLNYMNQKGIKGFDKVSHTNITSYILYMEKNNKSAASITRSISSMKTFFHYLMSKGYISSEPTELITPPRPEKRKVRERSAEDANIFFKQIKGDDAVQLRDRAMFQLMCATGLRVGEIIELNLEDVNISLEHIVCRSTKSDKVLSIKGNVKTALNKYLKNGREELAKDGCSRLFVNCRGGGLSRQGFWKIFKDYSRQAGMDEAVCPEALRHIK